MAFAIMFTIMKMKLSKTIDQKLKTTSKLLGVREEELWKRALTLYLEQVRGYVSLQEELMAWDRLSDEAFVRFEKRV